jgi:hypothetical protein
MGAARGALEADACMARALAAQERAQQVAATEENIKEVSRDAELAMRLITQDAEALRVDQEAALQAQANGSVGCRSQEAQGEGKGKGHAAPEPEVQERALGWEKKLGAGTWRGAEQLAEVVVQPAGDVVAAAAIRAQAQALACFAESRPLIQPNERENVEGVPDWVDNTGHVVRSMTVKGWWAPEKVLLDGGSYYSMVGARLKARLGLGRADMDTTGHRVQTALGKVETLPGGLTKDQSQLC